MIHTTHSYESHVSHDMHMCHATHSDVSNDSLKCVHMTHSCKPHDEFVCRLIRLHVTCFVMMRLEEESCDTLSRRRHGTLYDDEGSRETLGLF